MQQPPGYQGVENSFAYWRELAHEDPVRAAEELLRRVAGVSPDERRTAIAALSMRERLTEGFASTAGRQPGTLRGVPYFLKDLFDVRGELTGCSSQLLRCIGTPAERDARVHRAACAAGAVYSGRTHMNEFAYGFDGKNAHYGNCPHPRDPRRVAGGSSSGSAWAVGKGIVPLAFGTDTGGSVRVPAAFCGLFGFRRGVDEWATDGVFPLARSLDTVGWFTTSAADMAEVLRALWEDDPSDNGPAGSTAGVRPEPETRPGLLYFPAEVPLEARLREMTQQAAGKLGAVPDRRLQRELDALLPECTTAYDVIGSTEAYETHRDWIEHYKQLYDPVVWARIERGRRWSEESRRQAWQLKHQMSRVLEQALERYAFVALPATPVFTPLQEQPDAAYRTNTLKLSVPASLAGTPALTIPLPEGTARSSGLQIIISPNRSARAREILARLVERSE